MTDEQLEMGQELKTLIDKTKGALEALYSWQEKSKRSVGAKNVDNNYHLAICEHGDGLGKQLRLARYYGNTRLLEVIRKELEAQLDEFEKEYSEL